MRVHDELKHPKEDDDQLLLLLARTNTSAHIAYRGRLLSITRPLSRFHTYANRTGDDGKDNKEREWSQKEARVNICA